MLGPRPAIPLIFLSVTNERVICIGYWVLGRYLYRYYIYVDGWWWDPFHVGEEGSKARSGMMDDGRGGEDRKREERKGDVMSERVLERKW